MEFKVHGVLGRGFRVKRAPPTVVRHISTITASTLRGTLAYCGSSGAHEQGFQMLEVIVTISNSEHWGYLLYGVLQAIRIYREFCVENCGLGE